MSDDLDLQALDIHDLAQIVDTALASLNAKVNDPNEPDEDLGPLITAACDRWDEFADALPNFREPDAPPDTTDEIRARLEYLRGQIRAESISYGEIAELQGLIEHIEAGDVELLEWAGVPERLLTADAADLDPGDPDEAAELTRRAKAAEQ